jgi:hypothetical protein
MTFDKAMITVFVVCLISAAEVSAQHRPVPGGLLRRTPWYRLEMVAGRLRLVGTRLGLKATLTVQCPDGVAKEVLSYAATDVESASIRYDYQDAQQQWLVDIELSRRVLIRYRSSDRENANRVEYRQPLSGPVSVAVEHDAETSQLAAPDFWRLLLADPDFCGRHLIPVLETLRTGWSLAAFGQQIERALLDGAAADALLDRQMLEQAVRQLGDPEFQRRQAAERRLRDLGQRAATYLEQVTTRELCAEQRYRLRQIRRSLLVRDGDTPDRIALWLIDDPGTWISLLDREDASQRVTAAQHLERLLDRPLDYDPWGAEPQRFEQLARLRTEFGTARPIRVGELPGDRSRF